MDHTLFILHMFLAQNNCGCSRNQFLCKNQQCIPFNRACDGMDDCGDMSDEPAGCTRMTIITIMVVVVLNVVFIVNVVDVVHVVDVVNVVVVDVVNVVVFITIAIIIIIVAFVVVVMGGVIKLLSNSVG